MSINKKKQLRRKLIKLQNQLGKKQGKEAWKEWKLTQNG